MINVLLSVHIPESTLPEESSPDDIPSGTRNVPETSHFQGIYDAVVCMRAIANFKARCAIRLELLLVVLDYPTVVGW